MTLPLQGHAEWRKIPAVPDRYEVSNGGVVRKLPRDIVVVTKTGKSYNRHVEGHTVKPYVRSNGKSRGHPVVSISYAVGDETKKVGEVRVSLLVARAFHGCPYPPGDLAEGARWRIRHIDGDIMNVCADNLEWIGNSGASSKEAQEMYDYNIRRLQELRDEPVEAWIKRIWGDDADGLVA